MTSRETIYYKCINPWHLLNQNTNNSQLFEALNITSWDEVWIWVSYKFSITLWLSILLTSNSLWELNVFLGQISSVFSSSEVIFRNDSIWSSFRPRAVFNCALKNSQEPVNISIRRPSVQGAVMSILWLKGTEIMLPRVGQSAVWLFSLKRLALGKHHIYFIWTK